MLAEKQREEKIKDNINLVHALAARFKDRGIEYDDLFQAGCVGLIKSVDGFDESRGFAFSTYAVPVILGEMKALFRSGGAIKISRSMKQKGIEALKQRDEFMNRTGREPSVNELSQILGMSAAETAEVLSCNLPVMSLTAREGDEFDISIPSPSEGIEESLSLKQALSQLEATEKDLIEYRFFKEYTQSKTAEILGTSQVQISRLEKKVLQKLRYFLQEN